MKRGAFLALAALAISGTLAFADTPMINADGGIAAGGYDVVSYQQSSGPVMGDAKFTAEWEGAKWQFANAEGLAAFKASPEKYAPQYGGYCAYAISKGATAPGDPKVFKVVDGKVYLNFSKSVQSTWVKDIPGNIALANKNWPNVLK